MSPNLPVRIGKPGLHDCSYEAELMRRQHSLSNWTENDEAWGRSNVRNWWNHWQAVTGPA